MEHLIAKLLHDFEQGKMDRRQLIRSIAAAAAVVAAPAAAEGKGFQAVAVNHISYVSTDYARTRDFYADLLGMKVSHDDGKQCYMSFGDTFFLPRNGRGAQTPPVISHLAYTIDNWDKNAVEAELKRRGLNPRPDTDDSFHVKDPDGYDLQISGKNMKA
ncbi:MAG: VOC family protein [Bryobacteraceae bacterium]|jgi:catechol 2,3-dioxygenase-like lactoylglutathione lyase family enzyme